MMKILADSAIPYVEDYFASCGELVLKKGRAITHDDVQDADILLVRTVTSVNADLLRNTNVKFVGTVTSGKDHLDIDWLEQQGIAWADAKGFNAPAVADYVVSIVAALQRQQRLSTHDLKAAVIGCGETGQRTANYLRALGMLVITCDPLLAAQDSTFTHTVLADINDVDLISLHVPLTHQGQEATYQFINKHFLSKQKTGCVLLNASRGEVIHLNDLWQYGRQLTWCFDVWPNEPHVDPALLQAAYIATPHIAGYSVQSKMRGIRQIYDKMRKLGLICNDAVSGTPQRQVLSFATLNPHWQDVVLGIFNPIVMTMLMRTAQDFDEMRRNFTYRHELANTTVELSSVLPLDRAVLTRLGVRINLTASPP